jgi:hypothetical protein
MQPHDTMSIFPDPTPEPFGSPFGIDLAPLLPHFSSLSVSPARSSSPTRRSSIR